MSPISDSFLDTLRSHLQGLEESGVRQVKWQGPRPGAADTPPPPPRPEPVIAKPPPREKPEDPAVLPTPPAPEPVAPPPGAVLVWMSLARNPDCEDPGWNPDDRVALVLEKDETEGKAGTLLADMLRAIGFDRDGDLRELRQASDLKDQSVRVLAMGNAALQAISPAGMDLKIVRGMWQSTPAGKLISTYAPSAVQDSPEGKKTVWSDLQTLLDGLGLQVPEWTRTRLRGGRG